MKKVFLGIVSFIMAAIFTFFCSYFAAMISQIILFSIKPHSLFQMNFDLTLFLITIICITFIIIPLTLRTFFKSWQISKIGYVSGYVLGLMLLVMTNPFGCYIKRPIEGRLKHATDDIDRQFKERKAGTPYLTEKGPAITNQVLSNRTK